MSQSLFKTMTGISSSGAIKISLCIQCGQLYEYKRDTAVGNGLFGKSSGNVTGDPKDRRRILMHWQREKTLFHNAGWGQQDHNVYKGCNRTGYH